MCMNFYLGEFRAYNENGIGLEGFGISALAIVVGEIRTSPVGLKRVFKGAEDKNGRSKRLARLGG